MSKKDYQAIAAAIYRARQELPAFSQRSGGAMSPAEFLTLEIMDVLQSDNPRFDRARFIEACETGKTRGMRQAS